MHPLTNLLTTCTVDTQVIILQPPYGSFTATQPPANISVTANVSDLADANVALSIKATAGFYLGNTPAEGDDPAIIGATSSASFTPILFTLKKTYLGPEDETATGPNFPRQYQIEVDIANGQTINNLDLTDLLPNNLQYVSVDATTTASRHANGHCIQHTQHQHSRWHTHAPLLAGNWHSGRKRCCHAVQLLCATE